MEKPASVAAYFRSCTPEQRAALGKLRDTIAAAAPDAEPGIAWSMPGFKLRGKAFVGYAAFKNHYSFFPMSTAVVRAHEKALSDHVTGKGTISFGYDERLPIGVIRKIVKSRLAEVEATRR